MAVEVEGVGPDWLVTRQGGVVRLHQFASPGEIPPLLRKLLSGGDTETAHAPAPVARARLPVATPRRAPVVTAQVKRGPKKVRPPDPVVKLPECQACGACCAPADQAARHYVGLETEDAELLGKGERGNLVVEVGNGSFLKTAKSAQGRVCAAFSGTVGAKCGCSIYERRPAACRLFERGSEGCLSAVARARRCGAV